MNPPEFDAFVNHFCACKVCKPMHNKYCAEGKRLHDEYQNLYKRVK